MYIPQIVRKVVLKAKSESKPMKRFTENKIIVGSSDKLLIAAAYIAFFLSKRLDYINSIIGCSRFLIFVLNVIIAGIKKIANSVITRVPILSLKVKS